MALRALLLQTSLKTLYTHLKCTLRCSQHIKFSTAHSLVCSSVVLPKEGPSGLKHCNKVGHSKIAHIIHSHLIYPIQSSAQETGCLRSRLLKTQLYHIRLCFTLKGGARHVMNIESTPLSVLHLCTSLTQSTTTHSIYVCI